MSKIIKLSLLSTIICLTLAIGIVVLAQEDQNTTIETTAIEEVALDETVKPEDLGVKDQKVLPDSPFYFLKDLGRKIQSIFTFNKVKKAELENKFANEKLIELKKLAEKNATLETIEKATENYKKATEKVKEKVDKIQEKAAESEKVDNFLDKFTKQQVLQEKILQKLETQVPAEVFEKIKEARESHLEKFGEVMTKLENREEKIKEKLENVLKEQEGSQFKDFKNLEILKNIEEKIPEQAKEAIQQAQENALKRLQGDLEKMSTENQEKLKDYIDKISGDKEKQLEILENIGSEVQENLELKEKLKEAREKVLEKIKIEPLPTTTCPVVEKPSPDFCEKGRIVLKKDEKGCVIAFKCIIPTEEIETPSSECKSVCKNIGSKSEGWYNSCTNELIKWAKCGEENPNDPNPKVCITLWDPVCGKNGKTYSNKCFAKLAGVEVAYEGECKEKECKSDADCDQPKCGPVGVIGTKCTGVKAKCVEGKCVIVEDILGKPCQTDADCGTPKPAIPATPDESIIQYRCIERKCVLQL